jgi:hypothetical protein
MTTIQLTPWQRRKVRSQIRSIDDANYCHRSLAVLELDRGKFITAVADLLRVTRQSVSDWASAVAADPDPAALQDHYGIGRPSAWTEELRSCFESRPDEWGYAAVNWTVPLLQEHLYHQGGR